MAVAALTRLQNLMWRNVLFLELQGSYALFVSATEFYLCKDDTMSWLSRCLRIPYQQLSS